MISQTATSAERRNSAGAVAVQYRVGEFWTARQRQSHSLHEISYRACFKAQLPEYFIARHTEPGDAVLDPFMGRGTTPLQAHLMGRRAYGSDANPLCVMLARPRFDPPAYAEVERRLGAIPLDAGLPVADEPLLAFYHPDTLRQLLAYRRWFADRAATGQFDRVDDWIRMVCLTRLSGHSSGFFSVRTLPPNQAVSIRRQRMINLRNGQSPAPKDTRALILRKSVTLLRSIVADAAGTDATADVSSPATRGLVPILTTAKSHLLDYVADASIGLVVTSPPFLDVVDYRADNWLRCWFADIDAEAVQLDRFRDVDRWAAWMHPTLSELARVLRRGGVVAFEVGEVRKGSMRLEEAVIAAAEGTGLSVREVMVNQQRFTKTGNIWGVTNNQAGTNTNRIVVMGRG